MKHFYCTVIKLLKEFDLLQYHNSHNFLFVDRKIVTGQINF